MAQSPTIRNLYFYLVSFIALGFVVGSGVYLLNYVAKVTVFPKADISYRGTPPGLYFTSTSKDGTAPVSTVECAKTCSLTDTMRADIASWQQSYTSWRQQPTAATNRSRGLVNALSFLIVSLPIFWFHFRTAQKDHAEEMGQLMPATGKRQGATLRSIYFYLVALSAVVMFIISAGVTVNTVLKKWVVKSAEVATTTITPKAIAPNGTVLNTDALAISSLQTCAATCNLTADLQTQLRQWQVDYAQTQADLTAQPSNDWQGTLATSLPFLLASIPLFWLHWRIAQKERKVA